MVKSCNIPLSGAPRGYFDLSCSHFDPFFYVVKKKFQNSEETSSWVCLKYNSVPNSRHIGGAPRGYFDLSSSHFDSFFHMVKNKIQKSEENSSSVCLKYNSVTTSMHIEGIRLTSKNMSMTWWLEQQAHEQMFVKSQLLQWIWQPYIETTDHLYISCNHSVVLN